MSVHPDAVKFLEGTNFLGSLRTAERYRHVLSKFESEAAFIEAVLAVPTPSFDPAQLRTVLGEILDAASADEGRDVPMRVATLLGLLGQAAPAD